MAPPAKERRIARRRSRRSHQRAVREGGFPTRLPPAVEAKQLPFVRGQENALARPPRSPDAVAVELVGLALAQGGQLEGVEHAGVVHEVNSLGDCRQRRGDRFTQQRFVANRDLRTLVAGSGSDFEAIDQLGAVGDDGFPRADGDRPPPLPVALEIRFQRLGEALVLCTSRRKISPFLQGVNNPPANAIGGAGHRAVGSDQPVKSLLFLLGIEGDDSIGIAAGGHDKAAVAHGNDVAHRSDKFSGGNGERRPVEDLLAAELRDVDLEHGPQGRDRR